jgi:hypothetical protein
MANGIDFVIGGKDKASAAMQSVAKSMARMQAATVAYITATMSANGLNKINEAYDKQADAVKKLNSALAIRGQQAASAGMQDFAKNMEKLTGVSDQTTLGLMQQAQSLGFATDKMDDAAKAAIGLAAATGKTAEQSLGDMKAALEGNFDAFVGLNPQIMYMRTNQEKLAAVIAIANQGLAQQSKDMGTVAGSGRRADSAMGSFMETVGKILAPIRVLINAGLQGLATSWEKMLAPAAEYATQAMQRIVPLVQAISEYYAILTNSIMTTASALFDIATRVMEAVFGTAITEMIDALSNGSKAMDAFTQFAVMMMNAVISSFTAVEVVILNLSSVWEIVKAAAELAMISISENVMHTLTEIIPAYATWFAENFVNLIKDAFNGVIAVITNAGRIIGEMVYQIFAFIASGGEGGIEGLMSGLGEAASISLLDGFKSSLTSLPEIAERQLTAREKDLADKIGAVGGRLGQEFSDKMRERMVGVGSALGEEVNAATSTIDLKGRPAVMMQGIPATEGRLLTRGPGTRLPDIMQQILQELRKKPDKEWPINVRVDPDQRQIMQAIANNTSKTLQMEAIV